MIYYAKSADEFGNKVTNREHLGAVAALALRYGEEIGMPKTAWLTGIIHDFGKYSELFQNVLGLVLKIAEYCIISTKWR